MLFEHAAELTPILTQEQGKPLHNATAEIMGAAMWFNYRATLELPVDMLQDDDSGRI